MLTGQPRYSRPSGRRRRSRMLIRWRSRERRCWPWPPRWSRGAGSLEVVEEATGQISLAEFVSRLRLARAWLESGQEVAKADVVRRLGNRVAAHESCVTAVYLALRFRDQPFAALQQFIASCGGDADTIGAMAGAIWVRRTDARSCRKNHWQDSSNESGWCHSPHYCTGESIPLAEGYRR